nr:GNAT family N-acetyltransferase [Paenibacillus sp. UNC451MF]
MFTIREMKIEDYEQMIALWQGIDGLVLREADSKENIEAYLLRNSGLSYVCEDNDSVVGTVLCGHDGRRGFIYHVAVNPDYRKQKIGHKLVEISLNKLKEQGIDKCHIFVLEDNRIGNQFWTARGWEKRSGFYVYTKSTGQKAAIGK